MIFRNFFENALGSRAKIRILRYLLSERLPTSERELAQVLGISHTAVNKSMKDLQETGLVSPVRIGNVNAWSVNEKSYACRALAGMKSIAIHPSPLEELKQKISGAIAYKKGARKIIIFGSLAEGTETESSDIDLLIVVDKKEDATALSPPLAKLEEDCLAVFGNRLSTRLLTRLEAHEPENAALIKHAEQKGVTIVNK